MSLLTVTPPHIKTFLMDAPLLKLQSTYTIASPFAPMILIQQIPNTFYDSFAKFYSTTDGINPSDNF